MITIRNPEEIYKAEGEIEKGTFKGRWHFSFGDYRDPQNTQFGNLRVFNDDTLSPGAVWPLHPHHNIEVVTYCAAGVFRHADENGKGGILKKGSVQHTTVGHGMWHSEINDRDDIPMRFIQMWFMPSQPNLKPSVEQKSVERPDRTNKLLALVSDSNPDALKIFSQAQVFSCFLEKGKTLTHDVPIYQGGYLCVLEGGPINLNGSPIPNLGAAKITDEPEIIITAQQDSELLYIETKL